MALEKFGVMPSQKGKLSEEELDAVAKLSLLNIEAGNPSISVKISMQIGAEPIWIIELSFHKTIS